MHTEHLQNVRPSWVAFGWFLAAAATGLAVFVLIRFGLVDAEGGGGGWLLPAFAAGFFFGGWVTGLRTGGAPILHAVGIGLFSVLVWIVVNVFAGEPTGNTAWGGLPPALTAGLILLQIVSAALGALVGSRPVRRADVAAR